MSEKNEEIKQLPPIGARAEYVRTVTEADIVRFAEVSGDRNPINLDEEYAAGTQFGGRIAFGALSASFVSTVLGSHLPGPGAIYLSQTLKFLAPVRIGDTVSCSAEVIALREGKRIITLRTDCTNQHGVVVLTGEAVTKY